MTLSRLDMEAKPSGIPTDLWTLFVTECDKVRRTGRKHYAARIVCEYLRHHRALVGGPDYKLNNNDIPKMARAYMDMRGCWGFFAIRGNSVLDRAA